MDTFSRDQLPLWHATKYSLGRFFPLCTYSVTFPVGWGQTPQNFPVCVFREGETVARSVSDEEALTLE